MTFLAEFKAPKRPVALKNDAFGMPFFVVSKEEKCNNNFKEELVIFCTVVYKENPKYCKLLFYNNLLKNNASFHYCLILTDEGVRQTSNFFGSFLLTYHS